MRTCTLKLGKDEPVSRNFPNTAGAAESRARGIATPVNVVTPPERGKWRKENPAEIEAIIPLIGPTMEALSYEV